MNNRLSWPGVRGKATVLRRRNLHLLLLLGAALGTAALQEASASSWLEKLGLTRKGDRAASTNLNPTLVSSLSGAEVTDGLKAALASGIRVAVDELSKPGGFLNDPLVRIPLPESFHRVEATLRALGQGRLVEDFQRSMNHAAEQATPEAAEVLGQALRQMTLADARTILTGTNTAATAYFRRTTETNLVQRFRPIVERATHEAGVTAAFKSMMNRAPGAAALLGPAGTDLDGYVTARALDGVFTKIAEQEQRIRSEPAARTTELLKRVFGSVGETPAKAP